MLDHRDGCLTFLSPLLTRWQARVWCFALLWWQCEGDFVAVPVVIAATA